MIKPFNENNPSSQIGGAKQKKVGKSLFITLVFFFSLILIPSLVSADIWTSPADPVINGNNYVFITYNSTADLPVLMNITDSSGILKQECDITLNEYGYGRCKYNFTSTDSSGTWNYAINTSVSGTFEVGKIILNVTDINSLTSIGYDSVTTLDIGISYENILPKEIVISHQPRDLGIHRGSMGIFDDDNDGVMEWAVMTTDGRLHVNNWTNMIHGMINPWRSDDVGDTYYIGAGMVTGDYDGDGNTTIITGEYAHAELCAWANIDQSAGTAVAPTWTTGDEGDSIRSQPVVADTNNDGVIDQAYAGIYQGYAVFYNYSDASGFTEIYKSADLGTMHYDTETLVGDFDNDSYNEYLVNVYEYGYYFYDVNVSGDYSIIPGDQAPDRGDYYGGGAVCDFDNDGIDEAIVPVSGGRLQLLEYNKSGTNELEEDLVWSADTDYGAFSYGASNIVIDDLNNNGRPDFAISYATDHPKVVFTEYNPETNDWYQVEVGRIAEGSYVPVLYADFDGDGIKEIMVFGRYSGNTYVFKFNGVDWDRIYEGWDEAAGEDSWTGGIV